MMKVYFNVINFVSYLNVSQFESQHILRAGPRPFTWQAGPKKFDSCVRTTKTASLLYVIAIYHPVFGKNANTIIQM